MIMRKSLLLVTVLTLGSMACIRTATNEATGDVDLDIESPTKTGEDWKGSIQGRGSFATLTGSSRALVANGKSSITVTLQNAPPATAFAWDVREGKCGERGPLLGTSGAYLPITTASDGTGGRTVQIDARLDEAKDYVVNIYQLSSSMNEVVACGDLDD
jgi:hypothetical protein